ncbi:MAG TPA: response regulator transcription factor [Thermoanaerobaculia bacterium]|jgi:two-component system alkaline phosphatase synthesis response regulator PhoP
MPERRILLVEDEEALILTLQDRFVSEGYDVTVASDGELALELGTRKPFDAIVLDVALPKKNGFDVCRDLRTQGVQTPILMLTARGQLIDRVLGLKLGADDYLTKPFEMMELLARMEALLRRARTLTASSADAYSFGDVEVDFRRAEVRRRGAPLELSGLELKLLRYLVEHRGAVLSRDELLEKVWGYDATPVTRTVDVHIASLRQKLEPNPARPELIITVHGMGYKFVG